MGEHVKITLKKSSIGSPKTIRATLIGLGLTRLNKSIVRKNTPEIKGMLEKVAHLITVEE